MRMRMTFALAGTLLLLMASQATAAVPTTMVLEGLLTSTGGGAAADGDYKGTFSIYNVSTGGSAAWTEDQVSFKVKGGLFTYVLGSQKPITAALLNQLTKGWLGIKVGDDPELPRQPLHAVAYALVAASASGLNCSGCLKSEQVGFNYAASSAKGGPATKALDLECTNCVKVSEMLFDATVDLGGNALKAKTVTATDVVATKVSAATFIGSGASLTGIKIPSGNCDKTGEVVKGIEADGTLICIKAVAPEALPADGINEISNGLIFNQFQNTDCGLAKIDIKDNNPTGSSGELVFGDYGSAQKINVTLELSNSNISQLEVKLFDPENKPYVLHNKSGSGKTIKTSFPDATATVSGDLTTWVGKNPQGTWRLQVIDSAGPGNDSLDGAVTKWCVNIQTLSTKKIQIKGNMIIDGAVTFAGGGSIAGKMQYGDEATFDKDVTFKGNVTFDNPWCPNPASGDKSMVVGGVCSAGVGAYKTWPEAVQFCRAKRADICSDAQALVLRAGGLLGSFATYGNWTNAYADNDGGQHHDATGNVGDDHGTGSRYAAPCCYNNTPKRATDQIVKVSSNDKGIRVVHIHDKKDASFRYAATYCAHLQADLCTKSQYVYLRTAGKVSVDRLWPNDGQDTDGATDYGSGWSSQVYFNYNAGFACCGSDRPTTACPAGSTDVNGVCTVKFTNSTVYFNDAAKACGKLGASICTISQNSVLQLAGKLNTSGKWSAGLADCDGYCSGTNGLGSVANNISSQKYGYACCL